MPRGIAKTPAGIDSRTKRKDDAILNALSTGGKLIGELADALPPEVGEGCPDPRKTRLTVAKKHADMLRAEGKVIQLDGGHYRLSNICR